MMQETNDSYDYNSDDDDDAFRHTQGLSLRKLQETLCGESLMIDERECSPSSAQKDRRLPTKRPRRNFNLLLWTYFMKILPDKVQCKMCSEILKTKESSTSPLHSHLRRKHKNEYAQYLLNKSGGESETGINVVRLQRTLADLQDPEFRVDLEFEETIEPICNERGDEIDEDYCDGSLKRQSGQGSKNYPGTMSTSNHIFQAEKLEPVSNHDSARSSCTNQSLRAIRQCNKADDAQGSHEWAESYDSDSSNEHNINNRRRPSMRRKKMKKPRRSVNLVLWSYFTKIEFEKVSCNLCQEVMKTKGSSTSPLHSHLMRKHKCEHEEYLRKKIAQESKAEAEEKMFQKILDESKYSGRKIDQRIEPTNANLSGDQENELIEEDRVGNLTTHKYPYRSAIQRTRDMDIITFIATTNQPFSIVEEPGFIRFVEALDPHCAVDIKSDAIKRNCRLLHYNVKAAVAKVLEAELPTCISVAFTIATWSSPCTDQHEALAVHYINNEFQFKQFVTKCQRLDRNQSADRIAKSLSVAIDQIPGLNHSCSKYGVIDPSGNMMNGMEKVLFNQGRALKCFNSILHSAVINAIQQKPFDEIFQRCDELASFLQRSSLQSQKIEVICSERIPQVPYLGIVQSVRTCWNSAYYCLDSILKLKQPLLEITIHDNSSHLSARIPTVPQFEMMEEIIKPLADIKVAIEALSDNTKPTIHLAMLHLATLSNIEVKYKGMSESAQQFCKSINEFIQSEYPVGGGDFYEYCVANFLHPKYKGIQLKRKRDPKVFDAIVDRLVQEFSSSKAPSDGADEQSGSKNNEKKSSSCSTWEEELDMLAHDEMKEQAQSFAKTIKSNLELEIHSYLHETPAHDSATPDILDWWSKNKSVFPSLCEIAMRILCIPVSSPASEMLCSVSGIITRRKRARPDAMYFGLLAYIHENYDKVAIDWNFIWSSSKSSQLLSVQSTLSDVGDFDEVEVLEE